MQEGEKEKQDKIQGHISPDMLQYSVVVLDSIERQYVEVLRELAMEPHLEAFKEEYEKIHRLLRKSNDGEKRLLEKIKELKVDLEVNGTKVEAALKLSQDDEETITALRKEIEKAWSLADSAHEREKESRERIQQLRRQVAELDELVDKSTRNTVGQEQYLRELIASKKQLESEREVARVKLSKLLDERETLRQNNERVQSEADSVRQQLEDSLTNYQTILRDLSVVQRERLELEQQVRECRATADKHMVEIEERKTATEQLSAEEDRIKKQAAEERENVLQLGRQLEEQQRRFKTEADRLAVVEAQNAEMKLEIPKLNTKLKERHADVGRLAAALRKARKAAENQQNEIWKLLQTRDGLVEKTERIHDAIEKQLLILGAEEKELHAEELRLKELIPQKTRLMTDNSHTENERVEMEGNRVQEEGKRHNLARHLDRLLCDNEQLRKKIFELEQSQTKVFECGQRLALQYHQTLEQTRRQRDKAAILQQQLTENEKRLKVQQDLLDRVSADRARTEKQLKENQEEWAALRQRHVANEEEIQQLKMQLIAKEEAFCRMHMVRRQLQRDIANAEQRASHLRDDGHNANSRREALQTEAQHLTQLIAECDAEKSKYQSKYLALVNERNVLATQLIRRNEELGLLYGKIRLQESSIEKGACEYRRLLQKVIATRDQLQELRLRCRLALVRLRYVEKLKRRKQEIEQEVFAERQRCRALVDELQRPVHVHRWRRLEGDAPEVLDGIYKVHTLERQILQKQDMLVEKSKRLASCTAEYESIRKKLAAMPGPELAEDLSLYSENLKRRNGQISGMDTELREIEQHADVLDEEVKQLLLELSDVKRRYFDAKHKNDLLRREKAVFQTIWGGSSVVANIALAAVSARQQQQAHGGDGVKEDGGEQEVWMQRLQNVQQRPRLWYTRTQRRREQIQQEARLVQALSTGVPASNHPLQHNSQQRQFVGGGFAITR